MARNECVLWEYGECMYMCASCPYGHLEEHLEKCKPKQHKEVKRKGKGKGTKCTM